MTVNEILSMFNDKMPDKDIHFIYEPKASTYIVIAPLKSAFDPFTPHAYIVKDGSDVIKPINPVTQIKYWPEWTSEKNRIYSKFKGVKT